jgi:hypothetical protein
MNDRLLRFGWRKLLVALLLLLPSVSFADNRCAGGGNPVPVAEQPGPGDEGGVGGTGFGDGKEGGIGGTGIDDQAGLDTEGGIGGTGVEADTAIIGTVTGFASICVGGTEIHYDAGTPVRLDGAAATAGELAVGQVVRVVAAGEGERVSALSIDVEHVVAGPITTVDAAAQRVEVMGQPVLLAEAVGEAGEVGQWMRVSGLRRADDVIVASRVEVADEAVARVSGPLEIVEAGRGRIGAIAVRLDADAAVEASAGVVVVGRWQDGELIAERVEADRVADLRHRVRRVQIEGYVGTGPADVIEVGGLAIDVPEDERAAWASVPPEKRVQIKARVERDGRVVADAFKLADPRRPPDRPPAPEGSEGHGPGVGGSEPPRQDFGQQSHPPPDGPARSGPPRGGADGGRPPRLARPPRPERPRRPDLPRAQRPPPPPRGPRPPMPPKPPPR